VFESRKRHHSPIIQIREKASVIALECPPEGLFVALRSVSATVRDRGYPDPHAAFRDAWLEAEQMVHRHWRSIVSVGCLLKQRGQLAAEELYLLPQIQALT
jgi:hypothetical protein